MMGGKMLLPGTMTALNSLLEGVARAKGRNLGGRDPHLFFGLRVDPLPSLALSDVELAEARDLDLVPSFERFRYGPHEGLQVPLRFALRRTDLLCQAPSRSAPSCSRRFHFLTFG